MNKESRTKHVWLMRHGQTVFDYENCSYDEFTEMLSNGVHTPLNIHHGIDFTSLPQNVELICYSPTRRAEETAKQLQEHLSVGSVEKLRALREVRFDKDIIGRYEYKSLKDSRQDIITRWFQNKNKSESLQESMARVRRIEDFLQKRQERRIVLVTHGWFLRLLELYFLQGKREGVTLSELLNVGPLEFGQFVKVTLNFGSCTELNSQAFSANQDTMGMRIRIPSKL